MTNFKKLTACGAALALAAVGSLAFAQDDLDDLLKDLEGDVAAEEAKTAGQGAKAETPAVEEAKAEEPAAAEEAKAEEPAAAEETKAEEPAAAEEAKAEEPAAAEEAKAEEPAAAEETKAEEPAAEEAKVEEPAKVEEAKVEEPAAAEEVKAEEPAKVEEAKTEEADKTDDVLSVLDELETEDKTVKAEPKAVETEAAPAAEVAKEEAPAAEVAKEETPKAEEPAAQEAAPAAPVRTVSANLPPEDQELLSNIRATEELRRQAFDEQAKREIREARAAMSEMQYGEAARHYVIALKLLNDSPSSKKLHRECEQGVAEGLYRAAIQEDRTGRRDRAIKLMEKAIDMRHPKARKQLELWLAEKNLAEEKIDSSAITHRRNDEDFKAKRKIDQKHLRRSRQLLSVRDIDGALEQCEIVLASEPYNQEALRLRAQIIKKQQIIGDQESLISRDGMIAEVSKKWRPVYAPNAKKLGEGVTGTVKKPLGDDPERSVEQEIINRMKNMRLPTISFKPPATIIDAVEFFRGASKDYDNPEIPLEKRGFNFVLKTPEALVNSAAQADEDDSFSATAADEAAAAQAGVPVIPMITASDVSFYEALKLVCDSVSYKFKVQGKIVMVMQKDMTTDEMVTRSYPVLGSFIERMGSASSDMKEMKSAGFGGGNSSKDDGGDENQEKDWKAFFEMMGVQWPEGSTIMYIKTIGKLRVKNTYENLAELEKALTELNVDQKLIEIEARFVEVCQEDLNSLGFEWILNSDYAIGSKALSKWLGLGNGAFQTTTTSYGSAAASSSSTTAYAGGTRTVVSSPSSGPITTGTTTSSKWAQFDYNTYNANPSVYPKAEPKQIGINAMGGTDATYGNGNRYLSTRGNHISGEGNMNNDQFMRVNAFLGTADLSMILHMLSQRSDTDLLSAPKVLTKPGEEAVIKVVTEYIYPTDYDVQLQSSGSGSSGGGYSSGGGSSCILAVVEPQSFTMREVGVILDVTPTLTDDGNLIDLKLNTQVVDEPTWKNYGMKIPFTGNPSTGFVPSLAWVPDTAKAILDSAISSFIDKNSDKVAGEYVEAGINSMNPSTITYYDAPMQQPFFHVRSIDSSVSINPGSTIVMGGLITEERRAMDDKIPFLGDIPFIGRLFRSHSEWTNKRNLLIFVTTRLVDVRGREVTIGSVEENEKADVKSAPAAE